MDTVCDILTETKISQTGEVAFRYYQKGKFLGKGGFANCYELYETTSGKVLAGKIFDKESLQKSKVQQKLQSEIRIHQSLVHPNIVRFEGYFEDTQRACILLELCPNKTLKEVVKKRKRLHELEVQWYISQLVAGLRHIHRHNVIHRDLKLGNLFLGKRLQLKIGDFGLAAMLSSSQERRRTVCGTPNYIAPEVLNSKVCGHSFEADLWSIGVIVYVMLVGRPPFESSSVKLTYKRIKANNYSVPEDLQLSAEAKSLIAGLLKVNPAHRLTLDGIVSHPFMNKNIVPQSLPLNSVAHPLTEDFISQYTKPSHAFLFAAKSVLGGGKTFSEKKAESRKSLLTRANSRPILPFPDVKRGSLNPHNHVRATPGIFNPSNKRYSTAGRRSSAKFRLSSGTISKQSLHANGSDLRKHLLRRPAGSNPSLIPVSKPATEPTHVIHYQDYTEKYGLGYILNNGLIAFHYNDMTSLCWLRSKEQYGYSDFYSKDSQGAVYFSEPRSGSVEKKMKILSLFVSQCSGLKDVYEGSIAAGKEVVVKQIVRSRNGFLLKFTNGDVQMLFADKSHVAVCLKRKVLLYTSRAGEKEVLNVNSDFIATARGSIMKRFKCLMSMLSCMTYKKVGYNKTADKININN